MEPLLVLPSDPGTACACRPTAAAELNPESFQPSQEDPVGTLLLLSQKRQAAILLNTTSALLRR